MLFRCTFTGVDRRNSRLHFTIFLPIREAAAGQVLDALSIDGEWPVVGFWDKAVGGRLAYADEANRLEIEWTDGDRTTLELGDGTIMRRGIEVRVHSSQFATVITATLSLFEPVPRR